MIEEQVRLGLQRIGTDQENRVGEAIVLIGVVELADAHVAGRMNFRIIGRPIVDAAVLHLHRLEIELAGAPGVLVAASRATMVEHGDEEIVLIVLVDDARRDARNEIERVVPARRLPGAVTPDHRLFEALLLCARLVGAAVLGHARAAHRPEARIHAAVLVGLDDEMHVLAVLLDDVVHRRRIPGLGFSRLLL